VSYFPRISAARPIAHEMGEQKGEKKKKRGGGEKGHRHSVSSSLVFRQVAGVDEVEGKKKKEKKKTRALLPPGSPVNCLVSFLPTDAGNRKNEEGGKKGRRGGRKREKKEKNAHAIIPLTVT